MMMTRSGGSEIKTRSVLWIVALGFFFFFWGSFFTILTATSLADKRKIYKDRVVIGLCMFKILQLFPAVCRRYGSIGLFVAGPCWAVWPCPPEIEFSAGHLASRIDTSLYLLLEIPYRFHLFRDSFTFI